jgi:hypothetical protein
MPRSYRSAAERTAVGGDVAHALTQVRHAERRMAIDLGIGESARVGHGSTSIAMHRARFLLALKLDGTS